ncbi:hypothetical protein PHJA_001144400 [Phtheirospermum japonicum]|uniref:Uncharacterized protein n=1 Tax=Phtheirospermum japonicum TaxID=374723 RepID=A0A830BT89_9LAMI|nr:hypothetical protein PHJA_001144400 [Phtheirospermum japonicum]
MEPTLEAIKGGGGSIKVGTTGTISALMSKELEPNKPASSRPKPKTSRSTSGFIKNPKGPETLKRTKIQSRRTHQIPMLSDDNISIDGTPIRPKKPARKGPAGVVEIVDIKCGGSDRKWVNPITDRLKKISFSKLSESII